MIFAISETVQLALINNFVPIVTVLISAGGAVVSWMGWKKAQSNFHGIEAVKEVVQTTSDAAVEAKNKAEKMEVKLDDTLQNTVQNAVSAAVSEVQVKHDKEMAEMRKQLAEARITGERRKAL